MPDQEKDKVAISDVGTKLYYRESSGDNKYIYKELVPITAAPATGAAPSPIEVTQLDSKFKQYIADRPDTPTYEFETNYTETNYSNVESHVDLKNTGYFLLKYGDGSGEYFRGTGAHWVKEVSLAAAVKIGISFSVTYHQHMPKTDVDKMLKDHSVTEDPDTHKITVSV